MKLGQMLNAGQTISLNQKIASYFGIGESDDMKVWLNKDNWCAKIPNNLTSEEMKMLDDAMNKGSIVLGKEWLPALDKDTTVREKYLELVLGSRYLTEDVKEPFRKLVLSKAEGNYTALEIITYVMDAERKNRSRSDFVTFLQDALDHYDGPAQLVPDSAVVPVNYIDTDDVSVSNKSKDKKP